MMDELMNKEDVAEVFGKTTRTIMRWVDEKKLNAHKIGGSWFFQKADVETLRQYGNEAGNDKKRA